MQFVRPTATLACISLTAIIAQTYFSDASSRVYKNSLPLLHLIDPETAHSFTTWFMRHSPFPRDLQIDSPLLKTSVMCNPIGVAAGVDKEAECVDWLFGIGFGAVEVGSVTPLPQLGNPKPRRLSEDKAMINRMGFNSSGHAQVLRTLQQRMHEFVKKHPSISPTSTTPLVQTLGVGLTHNPSAHLNASLKPNKLLGINLGKNKESPSDFGDYVAGITEFWGLADYFVVNLSSPNTAGLRSLQEKENMLGVLSEVVGKRDRIYEERKGMDVKIPVVVKIAPDLSEEEVRDVASVCMQVKIDGVLIGNSSIRRAGLVNKEHAHESGGLSGIVVRVLEFIEGPPIRDLTLGVVRQFFKHTNGAIQIIGCGGISTGSDAVMYAKAGASMVQVYTCLGYEGPGVVRKIKNEIVEILESNGGLKWSELVGSDHKRLCA